MLDEQAAKDQWVKLNTFWCKGYKGRISHHTCRVFSARAYLAKQTADKTMKGKHTWNDDGWSTIRCQARTDYYLANVCLSCPMYQKPNEEYLNRASRFNAKKPRFGRYDKKGLSKSSSIQAFISKLHDQAEANPPPVDTTVRKFKPNGRELTGLG